MAGNLTRDEARERARLLTVRSYTVELDLTEGEDRFESVTTVRFDCAEPGAATFIDLAGARVRSIVLNGRELDPATYDPVAGRIPLPDLAATNELRVDADCSYMRTGEGLHRFVDPVDGRVYLHSQFETADAHRMYACFDQPDLKADLRVHRDRPRRLGGGLQHRARVGGGAAGGAPAGTACCSAAKRWNFAAHPGDVHLHHGADRRAVPRGDAPSTTASRSASTAGPRSPSTSTPRTSSR